MKRSTLLLALFLGFSPLITQAATLAPGDLVKGSSSSVYYYGADGKRYVFPTEKTYFTWFNGFNNVRTVTDTELGALPIGGNITYRPGLKLVKITTDPKVYAISSNGTLRWVMSEGIAQDLYGANWASQVDDIPDAFFTNYRLGSPIANASEFSPSDETSRATTIAVDRGLTTVPATSTTPTPAPTTTTTAPVVSLYTGTLETSQSTAAPNATVNLFASASRSAEISSVNLFFDNVLIKRCEYTPCGSDVQMPTKESVNAVARFEWLTGQRAYATSTITLVSGGAPGIALTITRPEVRVGGLREVVASSDNRFIAKTIDIFIDGNNVRGCTDQQDCRYAGEELSPAGTVHSVYAILRDTNGFAQQTETKTFTVVENERPTVVLDVGKTTILRGEQVDVTLRATDDNGVAWSEIYVDDARVARCESSVCTVNIGPFNTTRTVQAIGRVQDVSGYLGYGTSTQIFVQ